MLPYAATILVSAFLLFQVQPMAAKMILPWFGGSAAVWTTCLLFFQVVLLLGYLYSHGLYRFLRPRWQAAVHIGLLIASLASLPVVPNVSWKPSGAEDPTWRILGLLAATVGLPYFLLSTTGPLMQAWYALRGNRFPYRLYALSNAGSMFALLSYPVMFEPLLTTWQQGVAWSLGYGLFVVCCGATAFLFRGTKPAAAAQEEASAARPAAQTIFLWIALPACASILLLAVSNHLSQNVAAIPFLWVLPLSLYLLSFILCFEGSGWYRRNPFLQLFALAMGSMAYALSGEFDNASIKVMIPLFSAGLFICCMVCHGELVKLRPDPRYLTSFYVMISIGGALGGVVVGFIAPHFFRGYYEFPMGIVATAILLIHVLSQDPESPLYGDWKTPGWLAAVALSTALAVYLGLQVGRQSRDARTMVRNFYGGLRVDDTGTPDDAEAVRKLTHGTINHGEQFLNPQRRMWPTTYYGRNAGIGLAIETRQQRPAIRVGIIGLGTGTLAAYGRPGDYYRFYEINPLVIDIANTQFTYLGDSKARVETALGDARLSLEREAPENFDVLAVDAFSSDSIPIHLMTREAFQVYFGHLKPTGILAVHVSNKYLALEPVVKVVAESLGKRSIMVDTEDDPDTGTFGSTWVLVSGDPAFFEIERVKSAGAPIRGRAGLRVWTDDYSNLFQIVK